MRRKFPFSASTPPLLVTLGTTNFIRQWVLLGFELDTVKDHVMGTLVQNTEI